MGRATSRIPIANHAQRFAAAERLPLAAFAVLMLVLASAGGASHPDVPAQAIARGGAALVLCLLIGFARSFDGSRYRSLWLFLAGLAGAVLAQLIPLPEALWAGLPGHAAIAERLRDLDLPRGPRPLNLVPDKGLNTLFALIVPTAMLATLSCLRSGGEALLRPLLVVLAIISALAGIFQAAGVIGPSSLTNENIADYGGIFANRNHQALFLSIGIAAALFWGLERGTDLRQPRFWYTFAAVITLGLSILLTGSRFGMVLGLTALVSGVAFGAVGSRDRRAHRGLAVLLSLTFAAALLAAAVYWGWANGFERLTTLSAEDDIRFRAVRPVWRLIEAYFPFGSGFGSFDAVFRMAEPVDLLGDKYLNHAHNDFLEFLLEGGAAAACLLLIALIWIARKARAAFSDVGASDARLGLIVLGLIALASVVDYPMRTPLMMAITVIAGCWLARPLRVR